MADVKLQREELKPGVKYKGYGMVNDYKEFTFIPEATGSRQGREKVLKTWETEMMTLKETKNFLIVTMKQPRGESENEIVKGLMTKFNELYKFIQTHEL